ncbi:MAG: UDP-N-acetylmuramoyl-L-alanine--D-glutamate ligase [Treponema sp.]|nr:UDP-N-acetylmuramoyl-L-alanine--D-glutamate ligase [Treponema sp.]
MALLACYYLIMDYSGLKVLIMGLGLHGGGLESAVYLLKKGARLTVTDLRDEKALYQSIQKLEAACGTVGASPIRYVLGRHEIADFKDADLIIKNPGVNPDSPYLKAASNIETDISLFLASCPANLYAVTGTKGKSTTASALHCILKKVPGTVFLGGNITVSPLSFLDELKEGDNVVLELSSWQLGDLRGRTARDGRPLLKPRAAVITPIMPDHLDRYGSMDSYVEDKRLIYQGQDSGCVTVAGDDSWGRSFLSESRGRPLVYANAPLEDGRSGGWLTGADGPGLARLCGEGWNANGEIEELVPSQLLTPGIHQKQNLLAAALAAYGLGLEAEKIREALSLFSGIEHRLEFFHEAGGIRFYNDSAATIPEAAAAAVQALSPQGPVVLVTGGTDKNLDFTPIVNAASKARAVVLLSGSGSDKLKPLLTQAGISCLGPFDDVDTAAAAVLEAAQAGCAVVLSPGCASFGMFANEFDRGAKWKEAVRKLA